MFALSWNTILHFNPLPAKQIENLIDKVESNALHFITDSMRSTPTAACHIHNKILPLELRREAAVLEMVQRYRRKDKQKPNAKKV